MVVKAIHLKIVNGRQEKNSKAIDQTADQQDGLPIRNVAWFAAHRTEDMSLRACVALATKETTS
jgi:hypothetical protein